MGKLIVKGRFAVLAAAQAAADAGVMDAVDIRQIPRLARVREAEDTGTAGIHVAEIILLSLNGIAAGLSGDLIVIGLISQRPDENGGTVSVPLDHLRELRQVVLIFAGHIRPGSLEADRGLLLHIDTQLIAGVQHMLGNRIMRGTDKIDIGILVCPGLLKRFLPGHGTAHIVRHIMPAGSSQLHLFSVDIDLVAIRAVRSSVLDFPETDTLFIDLGFLPVHYQSGAQGVQVGMLRVPLFGSFHRNGHLHRVCQHAFASQHSQGLIPLLFHRFIGFF